MSDPSPSSNPFVGLGYLSPTEHPPVGEHVGFMTGTLVGFLLGIVGLGFLLFPFPLALPILGLILLMLALSGRSLRHSPGMVPGILVGLLVAIGVLAAFTLG